MLVSYSSLREHHNLFNNLRNCYRFSTFRALQWKSFHPVYHARIFIQHLKDKPLEIVLLAQRKSIFKIIKYATKFPFKTLFQSTLLPPVVRGLFPNHPLINREFSVSLVLVDLVGKKKKFWFCIFGDIPSLFFNFWVTFKNILLKHTHTIKFTHLKCTVMIFKVHMCYVLEAFLFCNISLQVYTIFLKFIHNLICFIWLLWIMLL